nr:DUF4442 domain-containing protein [Oceanococcus sp. HetDA_MAG_MS8]
MDLLALYARMSKVPGGKAAFSKMVALKAPYFRTVSPVLEELSAQQVRARLRKRWSVTNHIGTVHAIAMCNLAEFTGGLLTEVACPPSARWIPKGMQVEYLAKANTDLVGTAQFPADVDWSVAQTVAVPVEVCDREGTPVFRASIDMYCSPKPAASKAA